MHKEGYYSSGQFARMAEVSIRTIRFYDKQNILKPSLVTESGARFYTDSDLARLQQILLFKYLGFSLDDIRELTIDDANSHFLLNSLKMQQKLIQDQIERLMLVEKSIDDTTATIETGNEIDWSQLLRIIKLTNMEKSLKSHYQNANNLSARINLHHLYSQNQQGWFPWLFEHLELCTGMNILELGCGNGAIWRENLEKLPDQISICLTDVSEGMIRDARRELPAGDPRFSFATMDAQKLKAADDSYDLVIANHVLFHCRDIPAVFEEVKRVLKKNGVFFCSTYGSSHMLEMNRLVQEFDSHIVLSSEKLYERFGLENGEELLKPYFSSIRMLHYDDELRINKPEPLIEYIMSCHGNQNQYIRERYLEFRSFVREKTRSEFRITKDAGVFICVNT